MGSSAVFRPRLLCWTLLAVFAYVPDAFAYLDPGTGSILLQGLIAGLAGGLMFLRLYWKKLKEVFTGRTAETLDADREPQQEE